MFMSKGVSMTTMQDGATASGFNRAECVSKDEFIRACAGVDPDSRTKKAFGRIWVAMTMEPQYLALYSTELSFVTVRVSCLRSVINCRCEKPISRGIGVTQETRDSSWLVTKESIQQMLPVLEKLHKSYMAHEPHKYVLKGLTSETLTALRTWVESDFHVKEDPSGA